MSKYTSDNDTPFSPTETFSNRDSLVPSSIISISKDSIITESTDIDSSIVASSDAFTSYNGEEKSQTQNLQRQSLSKGLTIPFYRRKRFWAICGAVTVVLSGIFIPLLFLVIIPSISQNLINTSSMDIKYMNITQPTNNDFLVSILAEISGAGPFSAAVNFDGSIDINQDGRNIGSFELPPFSISNGKGVLTGQDVKFTIKDSQGFASFASNAMVSKSVKWTLQGSTSLHVLGMTYNLKLNKEITFPGSNSFQTSLEELSMTQNPDKSLHIIAKTNLHNPSPIGIEIGNLTIQFGYDQTIITNTTVNDIFIVAGNNILTIEGTALLPVTDVDKLNYEKIMNAYLTNKPLNTTAKVLSILPKSGIPVDWLNSAMVNLSLPAVIGNQDKPPQIIKNVYFGPTNVKFTSDSPYSPLFSAKNVTGEIDLPFKVDFAVKTLDQKLTLFYKNKAVATLESPEAPAFNNATDLIIDIAETQLKIIDDSKDSKDLFSDLFTSLTTTSGSDIVINGESNIKAFTSIIGDIQIQGLPFNITTNVKGFEQFSSNGPPPISNTNIIAGSDSQLFISAIVTLTNPTEFSISAGKISFNLFYNEQKIGTSIIEDLTISPGPNSLGVLTILDDPEANAGKDFIISYLSGQQVSVNIKGSEDSTDIESLKPAFKSIDMTSTIPTPDQSLFSNSKIVVDNQTSIPIGNVDISNFYNAPITIYTMKSSFAYNGATIGTIDQDLKNNPIFIPGNTIQPVKLPVNMPADPETAIPMVRTLAQQNGLDVSVFDSLIAFSKINVPGVDPNVQPTPEAIKSFDLKNFVTKALSKIPISVDLNPEVSIGYYYMSLSYKQNIIATTDDSIVQLVPKFATPIISQIINQATINFDSIFIQNIDVNSFDITVSAQIPNTGPISAQISFPNGINVSSQNINLGILNSQPITAVPPGGAKISNISKFLIADIPTFTNFAASAFTADSVTYDISSNTTVTASGISMSPVSLKTSFTLGGFGGLKQFTPKQNDFTADQNGLVIKTTVELNNPSIVGMELGILSLDVFVNSQKISTISGNVVIAPKQLNTITFQGPITLDQNLLGSLISKTAGTTITIQGASVTPPKATGEVVWLNTLIKGFSASLPFDPSALLGGKSAPAPAPPAA